ncbi:MAG: FlgO family outer membrane protein [Thermodesulfobacteriota bacterium]|nr:FlgO family outer membrane protein [Thermodesulfobacteriota bacterium]
MKKQIVVFLFSMLIVLMFQESWAGLQKTKIAVLDFKVLGKGHVDTQVGNSIADQLIEALDKDWRFEVVEPGLIKKVIREQQLVLEKKEHRLIITDLAKLLGAKVLISGFVIKYGNIIEIEVRVINADNASIIAAESMKIPADAPLESLADQAVEKVINIFPFKGIVVFRTQDRITVDLGRCDGIKSGMHFAVFKGHKVIRCPETRRVIDCDRMQTGVFEIENVKDKISTARVLVEKFSGAIDSGQTVESAEELLIPEDCR